MRPSHVLDKQARKHRRGGVGVKACGNLQLFFFLDTNSNSVHNIFKYEDSMIEIAERGGVDLHTHTTASDGEFTPKKLVEEAVKCGLDAIGITDHDTVDGIDSAIECAQNKNIKIVPGVEMSCDVPKGNCHILGFFINHKSPFLREPLNFLRARRRERAALMLSKLEKLGMKIELTSRPNESSVGRPHIAAALVKAGYAGSIDEAFQLYLAEGRPAYIPSPKLLPTEAIDLVIKAGGVPALAHPHTFDNEMMIEVYSREGLCGIEADYLSYNHQTMKRWRKVADRLGLLIVGGSDFHGSHRPDRKLGMIRADVSILEKLINKRRII